ncbi:RNA-directed DNA polymerase [Sesamum angolense]|uniref:RNA-directed DNA polymerase n=1 Tax=Sesamum angolense TaxID=2727404 RepID=A0AAE1T9M7_9LAMI|nr:RNA-directed DNA polymerase [Sesamum angolense]
MTFKYHMCIELPKKLPPRRATDHAIELEPGARPPAQAPYRMAPVELVELRKQLDELLEAGLVQPSKAPYGSPVLFQRKQDGSMRMCVDYLALNTVIIKNKYPIPNAIDFFHKLTKAKYYTKIDLRSGYWQVRVARGDEPKTTCVMRYGSFEFFVMPFGLTNAPATFCNLMNDVLYEYLDRFVVYLDDIAVHQGLLENCKTLKGFAEERSEVDASDRALGGVLVQDKHYIAFESRKLKDAELRYSTHEKEMTAVIYSEAIPKQARWQEFLGEFDFEWVHRPGKHNDVANALSRKLIEDIGLTMGYCMPKMDRCLCQWGRCRRLFREIHDPQWAGHPGIDRMVALLARRYYWPRMEEDVEAYVRTCLVCQLDKVERKEKAGLLQPLSIPEVPWQSVLMDFILGFHKVNGMASVLVVVDRFFKMKKYADMGRRHVEFGAGDQMLLKLTPQIWKKISSKSVHRGLIPKYDGPFEVMSKVGSLAYRLKLPDHLKIHPTFHEFEKTVLKILDHRMIGQSKKNRRTDYLVHWSGESEADATWEQDVTLWQFEEKLDEYWVMREGVTPPTRALGSSGGWFVTPFGLVSGTAVPCTSGRGTVSAWSDTVMDSQQTVGRAAKQQCAWAGSAQRADGLGRCAR